MLRGAACPLSLPPCPVQRGCARLGSGSSLFRPLRLDPGWLRLPFSLSARPTSTMWALGRSAARLLSCAVLLSLRVQVGRPLTQRRRPHSLASFLGPTQPCPTSRERPPALPRPLCKPPFRSYRAAVPIIRTLQRCCLLTQTCNGVFCYSDWHELRFGQEGLS